MGKMDTYMEDMLCALFGDNRPAMFALERVHRSLGPWSPPGTPAHPIIACLLHYGDRDSILRRAREQRNLQFQGNKLLLYPHFTMTVQAARREFLQTKKLLIQTGHTYALLYPAKLQVVVQDKPHVFTDPKLALKFCKKLAREARAAGQQAPDGLDNLLSDND